MRNPKALQLERILRKSAGGEGFSESEIHQLSHYYELVLKWNRRIHLTTITEPQEFVGRHILESAFAESHLLDSITMIWDLGTGLGVPGIPLAIFRPEITVNLVDANRAKAIFLEEVVSELNLINLKVVCARIESLGELPEDACLTARAVERMERMLSEMLRIGARCDQMLIFGNQQTKLVVERLLIDDRELKSYLLHGAERRMLIEIVGST